MLTIRQLEDRLDWLEVQLAQAHPKDLPYLNQTYQRVLDQLVTLDLQEKERTYGRGISLKNSAQR